MSWTQPEFATVAQFLNQRTGLSFDCRQSSAEAGMRRAMTRARINDPAAYADRLVADDATLDDLINELTIGETYFFREPGHFRFIAQEILPEVERRRGPLHVVRVWSASCASGEEAYSLAILGEQQGLAERLQLAATDISRAALAKAHEGVFSSWSLRGDGASRALSYLRKEGPRYRLDERIRRRVTLSHLNLALDAYPSFASGIWGMDLILCRNVLIYFDRLTVMQVARRLYHTLAEGGWLITASSDPPLWEDAPFQVVTSEYGVFYRRPGVGVEPRREPVTPVVQSSTVEPTETRAIEVAEFPWAQAEARFTTPLTDGRGASAPPATVDILDDAGAAASHVRQLANIDAALAREACAQATQRHPFSVELHYLHGVLLLDARHIEAAVQALRRVLYLDRTLAVAHFTLGSILRQRGDRAGAQRAYRNARDLCAARPAEEAVPLADGEPAGRLAEVARAEFMLLEEGETL